MEAMDTFEYLAVGEDMSTTSARDAQHWSDFYRNLSSFEQTVARLKRQVRGFAGDRRDEAVRVALPELIADSENFEQRFTIWEARLTQLS